MGLDCQPMCPNGNPWTCNASVRGGGEPGDRESGPHRPNLVSGGKAMTAERKLRHFLFDLDIPNWPEEDGDPLDLENLLAISVSERGVEFCCGGDWQEPQRLLLTPDLDVVGVDGPTAFPDIEVDKKSVARLDAWLKARV